MGKKKNTIPSGFEDILGSVYSNAEQGEGVTNIDDLENLEDPIVEDEIDKNVPPVKDPEDGDNQDPNNQDPNAHEDDSPEPPVNNPPIEDTPPAEDPDNQDPTHEDLIEAEQVGLFFDALGTSLGWDMNEIDEKDRPLTVDQLTEYMKDVVNQN